LKRTFRVFFFICFSSLFVFAYGGFGQDGGGVGGVIFEQALQKRMCAL
jgi:hypothetical protein